MILPPSCDRPFRTDFWTRNHRQIEMFYFFLSPGTAVTKSSVVSAPKKPWYVIFQEILNLPSDSKNLDPWDKTEMADAHYLLFHDCLQLLTMSGESIEKREILAWIFAPNFKEVLIKGKVEKLHVSEIPFSFYRCVRESGIINVEGFKEELMSYINPDLASKLKKYLQLHQ